MDDYSEILDKFTELLGKSEDRIDRTNEMVSKCINIVNTVTEEYSHQIRKLQENRDELVNQNKELLRMLERANSEIEKSSKKYDSLLEKTLSLAQGNRSENNINLK